MTNKYATLTDYKAYTTSRGQTASTDTTDDGVISNLLTQASRYLDRETKRQYYPSIETRLSVTKLVRVSPPFKVRSSFESPSF